METPNYLHIVQQVAETGRGGALLAQNSTESCGRFTELALKHIRKVDARFGHVDKDGGEEQYNDHAVDAIKFQPNGQVIDIIGGAGGGAEHRASVVWQEVASRESNEWEAPGDPSNPIPEETGEELPDTPQLPPVDNSPVPDNSAEIASLRVEVARLSEKVLQLSDTLPGVIADERTERVALGRQVDALANDVKSIIELLKQDVSTSRAWGHSHRLQILREE
jgi:hypothetical protein